MPKYTWAGFPSAKAMPCCKNSASEKQRWAEDSAQIETLELLLAKANACSGFKGHRKSGGDFRSRIKQYFMAQK
jgi:hypothetical protein